METLTTKDQSEAPMQAKNKLTLKWGSVKGWDLGTEKAKAALRKWADFGHDMSAAMHHDTPEQKQALLDAIDHMDEIYLDWDDKYVNREEAKQYVINYGKDYRLSRSEQSDTAQP